MDKTKEELKRKKREYDKKYYLKNKEKIKARNKKYNKYNKDKIAEYFATRYANNQEYFIEKQRKYRVKKRGGEPRTKLTDEQKRVRQREYYKKNKDKILKYRKEYRDKNIEKYRDLSRLYYKNNKTKENKRVAKYTKERFKKDSFFRFKHKLRHSTWVAFKNKGYKKGSSTEKILGCSFEIVKKEIEMKFVKGMSWDNRDEWHIDHIIPLASAKTEEELIKLCHYTNLQPLWAKDNISKKDKVPLLSKLP